ncbi:hypothetical protein COV94_01290 [Candidatus Woesearchaeota archaeon CG11_big_fil_rev_8_21_14_0_20_57_5]|nr:MAG: hypothetical protein COV94_01290 [Candidatus Woesearchaeota archaeon CG11_big_fil_rev_8_21_14_0_20_57_5]
MGQEQRGASEPSVVWDGDVSSVRHGRDVRAQISVHAFVMLAAAFILVIIIVFGVKSVASLRAHQSEAAMTGFLAEFENTLAAVSGHSGSVESREFPLPLGAKELCLVDLAAVTTTDLSYYSSYPQVVASVQGHARQNIFILPSEGDGALTRYVPGMEVQDASHILCLGRTTGIVGLTMEGTGKGVRVSDSTAP